MKRSLRALAALGLAVSSLLPAQDKEEFREFTGANGKVIKGLLIDKTDSEVILKLPGGKVAKFGYDKLSEADQEYVRSWSKEKQVFLSQCRALTIRELLELRGYESFKFILEGNHIYVDGKLGDKEARFMIDTGAGSTVLHDATAKEAGCEVGPMDQVIHGIAGTAPAAWTKVPKITIGQSVITDQRLLSTDLYRGLPPGTKRDHDAIFGAEFMAQLHAVISYKEGRVFFRPDLVDVAEAASIGEKPPEYRIFRTDSGKTYNGKVHSKTGSAVKLQLESGQTTQLPISRLHEEDRDHVLKWTPERAAFLQHCHGLTVEELLELRAYQTFQYERKGNHIFVDGTLKTTEMPFMIDTGAGTSVIHLAAAKEAGLNVGPLDQELHGIGGIAMAGVTPVPELKMGDAVMTNRKLLSVDLYKQIGDPGAGERPYGAIFGADFLRELDGVITYREQRVFLRQD